MTPHPSPALASTAGSPATDGSLGRCLLLIWVSVVALLLVARGGYYFASPVLESGDAAINALQTDRAKSFEELHGNYSRFRFHHPGPAFFYAYALAELVLCDWLQTGLTPFNAHSLAGLGLQGFFFALGLALAADALRRPRFLPLALAAALGHFVLAGHAFWSIWPPHALLMPFFAFWLACVSVASGRCRHLPWLVLSGGFLIHGHVAQPLFVGALGASAYLIAWWRVGPHWHGHSWPHAVAAAIGVVFLLPLLIDGLRGSESNLGEVARHLRDHSDKWKKPLKGLLYVLSFFGYVRDQDEWLLELSPASIGMFSARWPAIAIWTGLLAASGRAWYRERAARESAAIWNTFGAFWLISLGLTAAWACLQTGRMYEYNAFFFYALPLVALFPLLARLAARLASRRGAAMAVLAGAVAIGLLGFRCGALTPGEAGLNRLAAVTTALGQEPPGTRSRFLAFGPEEWPAAAAVALALQRGRYGYFVDPSWQFMHVGRGLPHSLRSSDWPPLPVWRVVPASGRPGEIVLDDHTALVFGPLELPLPGEIRFDRKEGVARHATLGLTPDERTGTLAWIEGEAALIEFTADPPASDAILRVALEPWRLPATPILPSLEVEFNGRVVARETIGEPRELAIAVPAAAWAGRRAHVLILRVKGARYPVAADVPRGWSGPGLGLRWIRLDAAALQ